ncbi:MAG: hypothetical protein IJ819_06915, partial [Clostridiales bacterium]|nr:hypothetical protein [Clostridiales bacterium]
MKRAVLKRLTSFVASLLVVAIASPNFVYSVAATAHETETGIVVESQAPEEKETEASKETKAAKETKVSKEPKKVKETKAEAEETKAKEAEVKETEVKETKAKENETKDTETKVTEVKTSETKESAKETAAETKAEEKPEETKASEPTAAETSEETKQQEPSEIKEVTEPSETKESGETSSPAETSEESQPSESEPAESSETTEPTEETEPSETSETSETSANETAPTAKITVAKDAEEFVSIVANLPAKYRLIIDTNADLTSLNGARGVFYDGSYVLVFDSLDNYDAALKYLNSKNITFSIDGSVELCGEKIKCNNVTINPNAKTKIAIIDTGSDLANEKVSVMGDKGADKNGHGTSMASAVLSQTDDAYIISIKAIDDDGTGKVADVYAALRYAIDADCKVILMAISLRDLGQYEAFKVLVDEAVSNGIKVVASAGNNGTDASKYIPAGLKGVLTAGAMDENGVKLPKSNYGKSVEYYVVADSTSEAAAILAGKVIAGTEGELATTCKMSASSGTDDARAKFKINRSDDPAQNDFSSSNGETLYNNAAAFCIFAEKYIHSNHMEGSVAADKYIRDTDSIMEITPRIFPYVYDANYYFYFNSIDQTPINKKMISQTPDDGKPYASMYLGPDLVYVEPEKNVDGSYQITVDGNTIPVSNDLANNGDGRFIYSISQKKIVGSGNNPTTISGGGKVKASSKIDFDKVLTAIGNWAKGFYNEHDLVLSDYTPSGMEYNIQLHDGVNYINITEEQLNNYGFNFKSSPNGSSSIVINVVDDGDGIVNLSHDEANKRVTFDGQGDPEASKASLTAASHILFNFHKDIHTVNLGKSTTTELGTLLAPGADLTIASTHDGNAIARSFRNDSVEIHQAAFPFIGKNASGSGKVSIKKIFEHSGDEDLSATFVIYKGNYRSVAEINNASASGDQMTKNGNTYTSKALKEAGPYTIRETKTGANYDGLGDTLIHVMLHSDGSVELISPKSASNVKVDSSSTDGNLILDVTNSRKKATPTGSVVLEKKFTGFGPESKTATFKLYYGKYSKVENLEDSALIKEATFTADGSVRFDGLDEVGPYTIVETASNNIDEVGLIYMTLSADGNVTFGETPSAVTVVTNNSTDAKITVINKKKGPTPATVTFSKKDMTARGTTGGNELTGATMQLSTTTAGVDFSKLAHSGGSDVTVSGGNKTITWKTTSTQFKLELPDGTYSLTETAAPDGYKVITVTTFNVKNGKIGEADSRTSVDLDETNNVVTAFDEAKVFDVNISKVDAANSKELAGATLTITNADGNTFDFSKVTATQNGAT